MRKEANKNKKQAKSIWKWLFLALLVINLGLIGFVGMRVVQPRDQATLKTVKSSTELVKVAQLTTSTDQLNQLINGYLKDYQTDDMKYKFYVSDKAVLEGTYKFFGTSVPLYIYFEPLALADGSVSLSVESVSVGTLSLPTATVLAYVKSAFDLPDFVKVDVKNSQLIVNLPKLEVSKGLYFKANQSDLAGKSFTFDLMQKN